MMDKPTVKVLFQDGSIKDFPAYMEVIERYPLREYASSPVYHLVPHHQPGYMFMQVLGKEVSWQAVHVGYDD